MTPTEKYQLQWSTEEIDTFDGTPRKSFPEIIFEPEKGTEYLVQPLESGEYWTLGEIVEGPYEEKTEEGLRQFVDITYVSGDKADIIEEELEGHDRLNYDQASIIARNRHSALNGF